MIYVLYRRKYLAHNLFDVESHYLDYDDLMLNFKSNFVDTSVKTINKADFDYFGYTWITMDSTFELLVYDTATNTENLTRVFLDTLVKSITLYERNIKMKLLGV